MTQSQWTKMEREAYVRKFEPSKSLPMQFFLNVERETGIKVKSVTIQGICQIISHKAGLVCPRFVYKYLDSSLKFMQDHWRIFGECMSDFRIWTDKINSLDQKKSTKSYNVYLLGKYYKLDKHGSFGKIQPGRSAKFSAERIAKWIITQTSQNMEDPINPKTNFNTPNAFLSQPFRVQQPMVQPLQEPRLLPQIFPTAAPPASGQELIPCLVNGNGKIIMGEGCRCAYLVRQPGKGPYLYQMEPVIRAPVALPSTAEPVPNFSAFNFNVATKKYNYRNVLP